MQQRRMRLYVKQRHCTEDVNERFAPIQKYEKNTALPYSPSTRRDFR